MNKIFKIFAVVIFAVLVVGAVIFAVAAYNTIYPLAPEIYLPSEGDITKITIENIDGDKVTLSDEDTERLIALMANGKPTRKWSVNDYPTVKSYYIVTVYTSDDSGHRYFVYNENGRVYLELPYHGIYKMDEAILDFIKENAL